MLRRVSWYRDYTERRPRRVAIGGYTVDLDNLAAKGPHGELQLTPLEGDLLAALTEQPNRVLTRAELLERVWGYSSDVETRTVDNFIVRLRRYFEEEPDQPRHFVSVRGRGYMYVP
jgi:DNA-binding response OmpR family regulator